jgi:uracil-DNA glycosylase
MTELTIEQRIAGLVAAAKEIKVCTLCGLSATRTNAVPGAGPANADIMFIGEGPGANEDQQGLPFVGQSGRLLEEMLASINLTRKDVFISNVVKCRPPENRDPLPGEVDVCTKTYLYRQIDLVQPKVIATLGRFSMGLFFPGAKITQVHGKAKFENGRCYLPLFHPAAVLRTQSLRPEAFADFAQIPVLLAEWDKRFGSQPPPEAAASGTPPAEPPQQLTLL